MSSIRVNFETLYVYRRRKNTLSRVVRARGRNKNIYNEGDWSAEHTERALQILRQLSSSPPPLRLVSTLEY